MFFEILKDKKLIAFLITNFFVNIILLNSSGDSIWARQDLWPFTKESLFDSYDKTEFLLYGFGPIVLVIVLSLIKKRQ